MCTIHTPGKTEGGELFYVPANEEKEEEETTMGCLFFATSGDRASARRVCVLGEVRDLFEGKQREPLSLTEDHVRLECCFSLEGPNSELHVEMGSERQRDLYVRGVHHLLTGAGGKLASTVGMHTTPRTDTRRLAGKQTDKYKSAGTPLSAPVARLLAAHTDTPAIWTFPLPKQLFYQFHLRCSGVRITRPDGKKVEPVVAAFKLTGDRFVFQGHTESVSEQDTIDFCRGISLGGRPEDDETIRFNLYDAVEDELLREANRLGSVDFTMEELTRKTGAEKRPTRPIRNPRRPQLDTVLAKSNCALTVTVTEQPIDTMSSAELLSSMEAGHTFALYSANGLVDEVDVFLVRAEHDKNEFGSLYWDEVGRRRQHESRRLSLETITEMREGKQTPAFQAGHSAGAVPERCMSIRSSTGRALDMEAEMHRVRDLYMRGIYHLVTTIGGQHFDLNPAIYQRSDSHEGNTSALPLAPTTPMNSAHRRLKLDVGGHDAITATTRRSSLPTALARHSVYPIAQTDEYDLLIECDHLAELRKGKVVSPVVGLFKLKGDPVFPSPLFLAHTNWLQGDQNPRFTKRLKLDSHPDDLDRIRLGVYDAAALLVMEEDHLGFADYTIEELRSQLNMRVTKPLGNNELPDVDARLKENRSTITVSLRYRKSALETANDWVELMERGQPFMRYENDGVEEVDVYFVRAQEDKSEFGSLYWDSRGRRTRDESRRFELARLLDMLEGKQTGGFETDAAKAAPMDNCMSLAGEGIALDLEVGSSRLTLFHDPGGPPKLTQATPSF